MRRTFSLPLSALLILFLTGPISAQGVTGTAGPEANTSPVAGGSVHSPSSSTGPSSALGPTAAPPHASATNSGKAGDPSSNSNIANTPKAGRPAQR
jgi:hypothetical protein